MKLGIHNLKFPAIAIVGLVFSTNLFAADVRMSLEPKLIGLLDRAVLKIEFIDTKGDAVDIPSVDGLQIQYQGQRSETRIVNFKSTSKIIHTYVVTPTKVGDYTIGPVTCKHKGGEKELSAQLRVIRKAGDKEVQQLPDIMFARISTNQIEPYVYEPFDLTLKVYIRDGVQIDGNFSLRGGLPKNGLDGDLNWQITNRGREERNGTIFNVYTLQTKAKTLTAGTFAFQPEVQINVVIPRQKRRSWGFDDPFFGDFFGRQETRPYILECNRIEVDVQPVPMKRRPASFTGGVGVFDFIVDVGPTSVKAGEPITVKMRIKGRGNLDKITPPIIRENSDIKLYEARTIPSNNPNEVRFEQVLIPKSESITNIPAIAFSYFNTQTADFRTIRRGPFPVTVAAMPQQSAQVITIAPSTIQQETKILGRDIVYLKPLPKTWRFKTDEAWYRTRLFRILMALPALLVVLAAGVSGRRNALANDVALSRRQKAPKAARAHIQRAGQALRQNDETGFYEALWNALTDYFGHRFNLAPGEITLHVVLARFPGESTTLEMLFNTIEQRRYGIRSGQGGPDNMKSLLQQLEATLRKCEKTRL